MRNIVPVDLRRPDVHILSRAAGIISRGGVIVYPTETIYGIGADASNSDPVMKVMRLKHRAEGRPILILVRSHRQVPRFATVVPRAAHRLMKAFWPGPLTLVFQSQPGVAAALTQGTGTVGMRMPGSTLCLQLLELCGRPITSTSANISGMPTHGTIAEIGEALGGGVDLYLDAGPLPPSLPSTVVDVTTERPRLLREGAIPLAALSRIVDTITS